MNGPLKPIYCTSTSTADQDKRPWTDYDLSTLCILLIVSYRTVTIKVLIAYVSSQNSIFKASREQQINQCTMKVIENEGKN